MTRSRQRALYAAALDALVESRKAAGLTQQQLAGRLQKPQSFVSKYEHGERRLDIAEFLDIANAVGADPCRLIRQLISAERSSTPRRRR